MDLTDLTNKIEEQGHHILTTSTSTSTSNNIIESIVVNGSSWLEIENSLIKTLDGERDCIVKTEEVL